MAARNPIQSLADSGTRVWLDSIDPDLVKTNLANGVTGATSNPIIVSALIETGRFDELLSRFLRDGNEDEATLAWLITDHLVAEAQKAFLPVWERTHGDDGWVSFELDPLLEDTECLLSVSEKSARYVELGRQWSRGQKNRMIKVPATPGGLGALEELAATGVCLNVTLIFSERQYVAARDAVYRGARRLGSLEHFKSVYSIFVSRLDVCTRKHVPTLSSAAQGQVGIVNAKRLWKLNRDFWADKGTPLHQEIIFASTGTKDPHDDPLKYVAALAGSDIETNPPATNEAVLKSGHTFTRQVDQLPPADVLADIDAKVDMQQLEEVLMQEGLEKFADPHKKLLQTIARKRKALTVGAH